MRQRLYLCFFFFKQKTAYEMRISDWSSDVCSSDLRPDDYYATLADRYRAMKANDLDAAARQSLRPGDLIWVIVGDAGKIAPQLLPLGLSVEIKKAAD